MMSFKRKCFAAVMPCACALLLFLGIGATLAHADANEPYGWTVSYEDPQKNEAVKVELEFSVDAEAYMDFPCRLYHENVLDSVIVGGYDRYGEYISLDMETNEDGDYMSGSVKMEDAYGNQRSHYVYIHKIQHEYEHINSVEATCTAAGYSEFKCKVCGYEHKEVDASYLEGHNWGKMKLIRKATYYVTGKESRHCKVCGVEDKETVITISKKTLQAPLVVGVGITPELSVSSGYDDLKVTWPKVKNATGYQVQYKIKGNKKWNKYKNGKIITGRKVFLKDLQDGKYYQVRVRACIKSGNKIAYSAWEQETAGMTLAKVKISSIKKSGTYVTVKWKGIPTDGEDGYEIYRASSKNGKYEKVAEVKQKAKTYPSVKIKHEKGKTYYYKVKAFSRWDGEHKLYGPWSNKVKCAR